MKAATKKTTTKKAKEVNSIRIIEDENKNKLFCNMNSKRVNLSLKLVSEEKTRRLGTIMLGSKTFRVKRIRAKHLFLKTNSYGFNHKLLNDAQLFDKVRLSDDCQNEWLVPRKFILDEGHFMHFKNNGGFELQIFIKLQQIEQFRRALKI